MSRLSQLSRSVEGRVVLVTGAASGMGRATAHLFADEGAHVAVTDLEAAKVDAVVAEIVDAGGSAAGWTMDVANNERVRPGGVRDRRAIRRPGHGDQQRRHLPVRPDRQRHLRGRLGHLDGGAVDRPHPDHPGRPPPPPGLRLSPDRQHRLDRGLGCHQVRQPIHRGQARGDRLDEVAGGGAGPGGDHGELHLPRPDQHRHDGPDRRPGQGDLRQAPDRPRPLRHPRRGGPRHAELLPAGVAVHDRGGATGRRRPADQER